MSLTVTASSYDTDTLTSAPSDSSYFTLTITDECATSTPYFDPALVSMTAMLGDPLQSQSLSLTDTYSESIGITDYCGTVTYSIHDIASWSILDINASQELEFFTQADWYPTVGIWPLRVDAVFAQPTVYTQSTTSVISFEVTCEVSSIAWVTEMP